MTQKEIIKEAMNGMAPLAKAYLVCNWLEDINWHTECHKVAEKQLSDEDMLTIESLEKMDMAVNSGRYSVEYLKEHAAELNQYRTAYFTAKNDLILVPGINRYVSRSLVSDFMRAASFAPALSYIMGWGLKTSDWKATAGDAFVEEVIEIINDND